MVLAGLEIAFYFSKSVLPIDLLPVYPKWPVDLFSPVQYLPWVVLIVVIGWLWTKRESWGKHVLLGLGFFLVNLTPCPGFISPPNMGYAWVMDHFLYLPIIGLIGLVVAGVAHLEKQLAPLLRPAGMGVMAAIAVLLVWESHSYAAIYLDQGKLWTYTLQGNPASYVAHNNLGLVYLNSGRLPQAIDQFEAALKIKPDYAFAHNGLANALFFSGRTAEAIDHYHEALRIDPNYPEAHNGLGNALFQTGHLPEGRAECERAVQLKPSYVEAHCTLGLILAQQGYLPAAIVQFETAQRLNPNDTRIPPILDSLRAQLQNSPPQK